MECSICLDEIEEIEPAENTYLVENITKKYKNAKALVCGHIYHKKCINSWMKTNPSCPYCRKFFVNEIPCFIKKQGGKLTSRGTIFIDDNTHREVNIYIKNLFSKSFTVSFNRFNIVSVHMLPTKKILLTCFKTLYSEKDTFEISVKTSYFNHVYESFNKVVTKHYISKSRITPSVVSQDEKNQNIYKIDEDSEIKYDDLHPVRILSTHSSFSSNYSLRSLEF
jgi:hypothetical protein